MRKLITKKEEKDSQIKKEPEHNVRKGLLRNKRPVKYIKRSTKK